MFVCAPTDLDAMRRALDRIVDWREEAGPLARDGYRAVPAVPDTGILV
jgi:hypothetical protein